MRRTILDEAMNLFVRQGFEDVSMRRIARHIGYSPAALYRYFKNKREILSILRHEAFERFYRTERDIKERYDDPLERARQGCLNYVRFAREHPEDFRVMFELGPGDVDIDGKWSEMPLKSFELLEQVSADCLASGHFGDRDGGLDPRTLALALWSGIHGLVSLFLNDRLGHFVPREAEAALVDRIIAFIMRPGSGGPGAGETS